MTEAKFFCGMRGSYLTGVEMTARQNGEWNTLMKFDSHSRRFSGGGKDYCLEMAVRRKGEIKMERKKWFK